MLAYIFLESWKKLFKKRGIQHNKSINIDGSKVKLKANVDTILIGVGPMEEGKEGGCQLDPTAFVGLMKDELDICGKARTLLEAEAGSEGNPPYPDGPQEGKWNFEKAAGRAAVTVVVIGGTAVVVCGSMGASTPVIAGAAVTAGMAGGGMMVSDAIQGKVSSLEDYALSVASAELMFFTNQAMTRLITVTGMGFVSGTVAKAAGEAAAWAALDYLVAGEVDYERLARNLVINVVVDLGTGVLTGEAWEKPRQRTIEGGSGTGRIPRPGDNNFIGPLTNSDNHFIRGDGIGPKKRGVLGAHNMNYFDSTLESTGFPLEDLKVGPPIPHPTIEGIYTQQYRVPAYDGRGNFIGYKNIPDPKTIYDPAIISNRQMLDWGQEAMQNGVITGRIIEGTASNGLQFRGFIENGVVTNFFPVLPQ
ncbi:hypothetical protein ADH76_01185 [Enterocloster clostridioformis]|nr:CdiA family toxin C-terminal domain-containing protein [Enterocloster clostridioformis]NDO27650.1 hypothetical protein [Enterocloster clostridioformis]OXE70106.1 hypothetical protein ADH76_01185 [Enterocloster clostridioformis]QQR00251.1 EndoU domain-containing protein [Enterocloster clostridioformis]